MFQFYHQVHNTPHTWTCMYLDWWCVLQLASQDGMNRQARISKSWKKGLGPQHGDFWSFPSSAVRQEPPPPLVIDWLLSNKTPSPAAWNNPLLSLLLPVGQEVEQAANVLSLLHGVWGPHWEISKVNVETPWWSFSDRAVDLCWLALAFGSNTHVKSLLGAWASWKQDARYSGWECKKARQKPCCVLELALQVSRHRLPTSYCPRQWWGSRVQGWECRECHAFWRSGRQAGQEHTHVGRSTAVQENHLSEHQPSPAPKHLGRETVRKWKRKTLHKLRRKRKGKTVFVTRPSEVKQH